MKRSKKMILLCHCILNSNSKVEGLATYGSALREIVDELISNDIGIMQLPCPELTMLGIKRWGQTKEQYDTPYYRKHCRELFKSTLEQIKNYMDNGYDIIGILGINGSPSCGVDKTCSGKWGGEISGNPDIKEMINDVLLVDGSGIFIEEIKELLQSNTIDIPIIGLNESNIDESLEAIKRYLNEIAG
jgi:predicted secreted protein